MGSLKARVDNGRLVLDEPTTLPEGTELELTIADPGDDLDEEQRTRLQESIERITAKVVFSDTANEQALRIDEWWPVSA